MKTKVCIRCLVNKDINDFRWHNIKRGWRRTVCHLCRLNDGRNWIKRPKEITNKILRDKIRKRKLEWIEKLGGNAIGVD